jgi:hypothetical protein
MFVFLAATLHENRSAILGALAAPHEGVDPGYIWVARVRRVSRPAPALSRFRPLPPIRSRAHA